MLCRLGIIVSLGIALIFSPGFSTETQARSSKEAQSSKTISKSSRSKKSRVSNKRSKRRSARSYSASRSSYRGYYSGGICETPPLMKVIPQRDGRFLLEPLSSQKPGQTSSIPLATDRKQLRNNDDNSLRPEGKTPIYPRWSFRELILALAKQYQGAPYSRGASLESSGATDCSGFVQYIYQGFHIHLPRCSCDQAQVGKTVTQNLDFSRLLPGDLLFFRRSGRYIGHSGIYMGEGKMIHASNHLKGVTITDLDQDYYINTFVVAKRVFEVRHPH